MCLCHPTLVCIKRWMRSRKRYSQAGETKDDVRLSGYLSSLSAALAVTRPGGTSATWFTQSMQCLAHLAHLVHLHCNAMPMPPGSPAMQSSHLVYLINAIKPPGSPDQCNANATWFTWRCNVWLPNQPSFQVSSSGAQDTS